MDLYENRLIIPWMILPPQNEEETHKLIISSPRGNILEFPISEKSAEHLGAILGTDALWSSFFSSVISSIKGVEG